jgi:hypothetical protein
MGFEPEIIRAAVRHLRSADPVMRALVERVGTFGLRFEPHRFRMMTRSILCNKSPFPPLVRYTNGSNRYLLPGGSRRRTWRRSRSSKSERRAYPKLKPVA